MPPSPQGHSLMRMRSGATDDKASLAQRLLDPAYIRRAINSPSEKKYAERQLQRAIKQYQPKRSGTPSQSKTATKVRAGEISDLLKALMAYPSVKAALARVKRLALEKLEGDWQRLSTAGKAALITQTVAMAGLSGSLLLPSKKGGQDLYNLLRDREIPIPVPGVEGLQIRLKTGKTHQAVIMFDLARFVR